MFPIEETLQILHNSVTAAHFVDIARQYLIESGYKELQFDQHWEEIPKKFFVIRDLRALVAFNYADLSSGLFLAAHCDTPYLKILPNSLVKKNSMGTVKVAAYGGVLTHSWVDRDLDLGGVAVIEVEGGFEIVTFRSEEPVGIIPSQSIYQNPRCAFKPEYACKDHFNPVIEVNIRGHEVNIQQKISEIIEVDETKIIAVEAGFFPHQEPTLIGLDKSLISGARLDDLSSAIAILGSFIAAETPSVGMNCACFFNSEEVGSNTCSGALSKFLEDVLKRIGFTSAARSKSLFVSADVVHGHHPNFEYESDMAHAAYLGKGPAWCWDRNCNQATEALSAVPIDVIAERHNIPVQYNAIKNNQSAGSTFGPLVATNLGFLTIDIGIPLLAMHSIRETGSREDFEHLALLFKALLEEFHEFRVN